MRYILKQPFEAMEGCLLSSFCHVSIMIADILSVPVIPDKTNNL